MALRVTEGDINICVVGMCRHGIGNQVGLVAGEIRTQFHSTHSQTQRHQMQRTLAIAPLPYRGNEHYTDELEDYR